jgi:uncharacterized protein (TIGR01777 family)
VNRVAITGGTGLIGRALTASLVADGVAVIQIGRRASSDIQWDFAAAFPANALDGVDAVVNLAGEPIGKRWTRSRRRAIRESRVRPTEILARTLAALPRRPAVMVSGSAMGIYGDRGDDRLTESSAPGSDYLAELARDWENATRVAADAGIRVVQLRTALVLSRDGGALPRILLPFRLGVGGSIGDGRQWMSWIGLHDLTRAIRFAMASRISGPVNVAAPHPVPNREFTRALSTILSRPALFPVPGLALKAAFGEMAEATILASQRLVPEKLLAHGFTFDDADVETALHRALGTARRR